MIIEIYIPDNVFEVVNQFAGYVALYVTANLVAFVVTISHLLLSEQSTIKDGSFASLISELDRRPALHIAREIRPAAFMMIPALIMSVLYKLCKRDEK